MLKFSCLNCDVYIWQIIYVLSHFNCFKYLLVPWNRPWTGARPDWDKDPESTITNWNYRSCGTIRLRYSRIITVPILNKLGTTVKYHIIDYIIFIIISLLVTFSKVETIYVFLFQDHLIDSATITYFIFILLHSYSISELSVLQHCNKFYEPYGLRTF